MAKGFDIGILRVRNMTLLAKWLWRFYYEADSLQHKVIVSKYAPHVWDWIDGGV